jgi:hypothetical protein
VRFTRKPGLKVFKKLDPVWLKCGPYEVTEGIYPGQEQRKNWGWASFSNPLTEGIYEVYVTINKKLCRRQVGVLVLEAHPPADSMG